MKKLITFLFVFALFFGYSIQAHAALNLVGQGTSAWGTYNLIYDTDLDITWYDRAWGGWMSSWENAVDFADTLTVDFNEATYNDWRLPTALNQDGSGPCSGANCTGSEMGHLYYTELGNSAGAVTNTGDFQNLGERRFWLGTEHTSGSSAWEFSFLDGQQYVEDQWMSGPRWVFVRDGNVAPPVVPEPISSTLFLIGGATLGFRRFRKK